MVQSVSGIERRPSNFRCEGRPRVAERPRPRHTFGSQTETRTATSKAKSTAGAQKFKATLDGEGPNKAWTFLRIPAAVSTAFGQRGWVSVRGTINAFAFRSSIFADGKGGHSMMVNKAMRAGAKAEQGDTVNVTMEVDDQPRVVAAPADLRKALRGDAKAAALFKTLSPSCKKEYVDWIIGAKREETRRARVARAVTLLAAGRKRLND
jgi:hypothetical protein